MNRREAFKAIGTALAGTAAEGAAIQARCDKPQMVVVTISSNIDPDSIDAQCRNRIADLVKEVCCKAGWGDNMPVIVTAPGMSIHMYPQEPINVTIPPNTIVKQFEGYTVIYPAGHPTLDK